MITKFHDSFNKVLTYCDNEQYKGYDPYDGLNSTFFQSLPFIPKSKLLRLVWIQFFKRFPFNLRKLVGIKKDYNPKALGLFLASYCVFYKHDKNPAHLEKIKMFIKQLDDYKSKGYSGDCWGYNFDWEARPFYQPKFTPTIVASSFIANAILDAYEITGDEKLLASARSTCDFILKDLNRTPGDNGTFIFSYSPNDKSVIFNASLLGARLIARVYSFTKEEGIVKEVKKAVDYVCGKQREDGSWGYGMASYHQWVDNFHTGYNLECLQEFMEYTGDKSYAPRIEKGFAYYINTFFTEEGIAKYYSDSVYPIDIHAPAQLVITLEKLGKMEEHRELMERVLNWTVDNMQHEKGYFLYQINKYVTSKIPYMRWSQAWMVQSLGVYLNHYLPKDEPIVPEKAVLQA